MGILQPNLFAVHGKGGDAFPRSCLAKLLRIYGNNGDKKVDTDCCSNGGKTNSLGA